MWSLLSGDTHFYPDPQTNDFADAGTWPRARFISEFGFPSFPSRYTMEAVAPSPSDVAVNSTYMNWRQRYGLVQPDGGTWVTEVNILEMSKHFRLPTTSNASLYYDDFSYLSQANQALTYSTAMQAFRRQMSEPPSYTSGCLVSSPPHALAFTLRTALLADGLLCGAAPSVCARSGGSWWTSGRRRRTPPSSTAGGGSR